jgi:hypothetical protein
MIEEPASLILELLRQMRAELGEMRAELASKHELTALRAQLPSEMRSLRADVASDILPLRKDLSEEIEGLRQTVMDCHRMALRFCPSLRRLGQPTEGLAHERA